ncbi:hypothetical protein N0V85_008310 [Neurospora sp. IMI 360204]|nr:hypothetical protein N0V85_008310 [Neurospora sp. IMI 360204]
MARHATRQGVLVLTSDKMPAPTPITEKPKMGLYTYLPSESKCAFSLHAGKPALKHMLPARDTPRNWSSQKVQEVAAEIRSRQPDAVECMTIPCHWEDLHQYFHPIDLWYKGASNLLEVVFRLLKENEICMWVESWLTWHQNRYMLSCWDTTKDIMSVFGPCDWANIHAHGVTFPTDCVVFFSDQLEYWYHYYRNPDIVAVNSPGTVATIPPEDTRKLDCLGAPVTSSPPLGNSSLTVVHPPFARAASASIQATAPDFIPSIRRSSSDLCDKSADSKECFQPYYFRPSS